MTIFGTPWELLSVADKLAVYCLGATLACFVVDIAIEITLLFEYFCGRSDTDIRNEVKKKAKIRREKYHFESLTTGEGK
jgi:hypothetical protein